MSVIQKFSVRLKILNEKVILGQSFKKIYEKKIIKDVWNFLKHGNFKMLLCALKQWKLLLHLLDIFISFTFGSVLFVYSFNQNRNPKRV